MQHIQLTNNAFEGRNSIYLLGDAAGQTTLIDTGVATTAVRDELERALAAHDVTFADIDQIVLTHWHHDHAGLAGAIQDAGGAEIFVHEADAPLIRQDRDALDALNDGQDACLDAWGMPAEKRTELLDFLTIHEDLMGEPAVVTPIQDGDVIETAEFDLTAVHLPGHAAGLCAYTFEREGRREAFVGDAILPKYTPNVGGADIRVDGPLANYLESLDRIVELDLDRAWPGHRGPIFAPSERAQDIATHHEERTERVLSVVAEQGPLTAWEVSDALFGHLENIHILHGPGEAYAHLDHLVAAGVLDGADGRYELATRDVTAADALATLER